MRPRRVGLDDYAYERCAEIHALGGNVKSLITHDTGGGEIIINALVRFGQDEDCFLHIVEVVRLASGTAHRHKYAYHAQRGPRFLFRYDRDPDNHPEMPLHKHVPPDERRVPSSPVTLQEVMDELWPTIRAEDA